VSKKKGWKEVMEEEKLFKMFSIGSKLFASNRK
jgi:hypothetical protein